MAAKATTTTNHLLNDTPPPPSLRIFPNTPNVESERAASAHDVLTPLKPVSTRGSWWGPSLLSRTNSADRTLARRHTTDPRPQRPRHRRTASLRSLFSWRSASPSAAGPPRQPYYQSRFTEQLDRAEWGFADGTAYEHATSTIALAAPQPQPQLVTPAWPLADDAPHWLSQPTSPTDSGHADCTPDVEAARTAKQRLTIPNHHVSNEAYHRRSAALSDVVETSSTPRASAASSHDGLVALPQVSGGGGRMKTARPSGVKRWVGRKLRLSGTRRRREALIE